VRFPDREAEKEPASALSGALSTYRIGDPYQPFLTREESRWRACSTGSLSYQMLFIVSAGPASPRPSKAPDAKSPACAMSTEHRNHRVLSPPKRSNALTVAPPSEDDAGAWHTTREPRAIRIPRAFQPGPRMGPRYRRSSNTRCSGARAALSSCGVRELEETSRLTTRSALARVFLPPAQVAAHPTLGCLRARASRVEPSMPRDDDQAPAPLLNTLEALASAERRRTPGRPDAALDTNAPGHGALWRPGA